MSTATGLIKGLRAAGFSQSEIARRSGIPQSRISRWEAGDTPAAADDALRLQQLHAELVEISNPPAEAASNPEHRHAA